LDELDKEINTYAMRVREWYGWHFPEMDKIVKDNLMYAKVVLKVGVRKNMAETDFSDILPEEVEAEMKRTCEISMGTDISPDDVTNLSALCTQVISLTEYRAQLHDYLKNRMAAIAPNLSIMVGDLVGARLIAHAGSLLNLAKAPASTVQILGAEKALFRALKTKHDTPKYGLIFHASLIGQSSAKNKGKISRMLASKAALCIRVDALGDSEEASLGYQCREKVEARLRQLETGQPYKIQPIATGPTAYEPPTANGQYNAAADNTMSVVPTSTKKRKAPASPSAGSDDVSASASDVSPSPSQEPSAKKSKKKNSRTSAGLVETVDASSSSSDAPAATGDAAEPSRKRKADAVEDDTGAAVENAEMSAKKKKKKKEKKEKKEKKKKAEKA
jgi:nucleolar protein 58